MNHYLEAFIRIIFPSQCGLCSVLLELDETHLCRHCLSHLRSLQLSIDETWLDEKFEILDNAWVLYPYRSAVRELIQKIKFSGRAGLMQLFRHEMKNVAHAHFAETYYDCLIPVPLDTSKLMRREFNQSEILARLLSRWAQAPVHTRVLLKPHTTVSQGTLRKSQRQANIRGAFSLSHDKKIDGKSILLVDDVLTTGATGEEAARTLKEYGAKRVDLFALAKTPLN